MLSSFWACSCRPFAHLVLRCFGLKKSQNESSPNSSNIHPELCSEFSPNFLRIFRALFPEKRRPLKIHHTIPTIFQCQIPRQIRRKNPQSLRESRRRDGTFAEVSGSGVGTLPMAGGATRSNRLAKGGSQSSGTAATEAAPSTAASAASAGAAASTAAPETAPSTTASAAAKPASAAGHGTLTGKTQRVSEHGLPYGFKL